ncbi:MAG: OmpH family outer membrane protein [Verrucomicrobia bacterium]|nr:OmpH family outer membrane protein [Verrucomicrobiota bacterium]
MKRALILSILLSFVTSSLPAADLKVGLVDLRKAFAEYYKSKEASNTLQQLVGQAKEQINERFAAYKKLMDDVQKLDKERSDPVLSAEARNKKAAELQGKAQELRSLEQDINEFKNKRQQQIDEEQRQQASGLYAEIVKVVNEKAAAASYDLVFDKSNLGVGGVPFLVYSKTGAVEDFTAEVIVELNKNAPAGGVPAPAATPIKPEPKKAEPEKKKAVKK